MKKMKIDNCEKHICNLSDIKSNVVPRKSEQALNHGLKLETGHSIIKFNQ